MYIKNQISALISFSSHEKKTSITSSITLKALSEAVQGRLEGGNPQKNIESIKPLNQATPEDITFFHNHFYLDQLRKTRAGACLIHEKYAKDLPSGVTAVVCEKPYQSLGKMIALFSSFQRPSVQGVNIHPTAHVAKEVTFLGSAFVGPYSVLEGSVEIGDQSIIESFVHIKNSSMGKGCHIRSHVTIQESCLGHHVTVKEGASIGQDGFGFSIEDPLSRDKIPQIGKVVIEDHVDIGANTTVDRGSLENTRIGSYSKIDNLVQIAHNVVIGKFCVIAAQTGISGSTILGDYVMVGGQVGFSGHITIGNYTQVAAKSGVMRSTKDYDKIAGIPAVDISLWRKSCVALKNFVQKKLKRSISSDH